MKELVRNAKIAIAVLLIISFGLGAGVIYQQHLAQTSLQHVAGENRASLRQRYAQAGSIYTKNGEKLAYSKDGARLYAEDPLLEKSVMQIVGDYTHHITNTIETQYQGEILGNTRGVTEQLILDVSGRGLQGSDVHLTIDSNLNSFLYEQIAKYEAASAVLMNYQTGAILAISSSPSTNLENVIAYQDIPDTALFNRALQSNYSPASTFKILTAAAWINSPQFDGNFTVNCTGEPLYPHGAFDLDTAHGEMDLDQAFAASCNTFFGELAVKMGEEYFMNFLDKTGLDKLTNIDRLRVSKIKYDASAATNDKGLLSWFGTGQPVGELQLSFTPLHLATIASAIANDGVYYSPYIVDRVVNPIGNEQASERDRNQKRLFSTAVSIRLQQLMQYGVESELSVQPSARIQGVAVAGKSGTLERGVQEIYAKNGLWTGFIDDPDYPYAICVVTENVKTADGTAVTIAKQVLQQAIQSGVK